MFKNSKKMIRLLKSPELGNMGIKREIQDIIKGRKAKVDILEREMRGIER